MTKMSRLPPEEIKDSCMAFSSMGQRIIARISGAGENPPLRMK